MSKDLFSEVAKNYALYRPVYPAEIYSFIYSHLTQYHTVWDCATGNGQVAGVLSEKFEQVYATDLSPQQIEHAVQKPNIVYSVGTAENPSFSANSFDLITVGQAAHWFDMDAFNNAVDHCLKPGGLVALMGYTMLRTAHPVQAYIDQIYSGVLENYWFPERKLVDEKLLGLSFPFKEITTPDFYLKVQWSLNDLCGYFETWSATKRYKEEQGHSPVPGFKSEVLALLKLNPEEKINCEIPFFLRLGRK